MCKGNNLQITLPSTITYQWYNEMTGGSLLATGNTFTQQNVQTPFSVYLDATTSNGCKAVSREKFR